MKITFIGNCQTISLCFYFQQLLCDSDIKWLLYDHKFKRHLGRWTNKIKNKIVNYYRIFNVIKKSDVIVYQEISKEKSKFCNTETLQKNKKESCVLIKIPSIYLDYSNYDVSIKELRRREIENKVDIRVSDIFEKYRERRLILPAHYNHPNTFLFLEVVDELSKLLNIDSFSEEKKNMFLKDNNFMKLP